ncbi:MAG: imidazole glycerol phosphate synthase subunit HisH [Planctomycetota bacterium]
MDASSATPLPVAVIRTGVANLASVLVGLRRAGASPVVTESADDVAANAAVVLPGVGSFAAGMAALEQMGMVGALRRRLLDRRPTLAVCVGHQLLFESSDESPGVEGLGVAQGRITRFPESVRVPQLGWNQVGATSSASLVRSGEAYFANSYRAKTPPSGFECAMTDHAGPFVAAMASGPVLTCQFHPELSGAWGSSLLSRWVSRASAFETERASSC